MDIDSLTIGEAKQLASMFQGVAHATESPETDHGFQIVIAERGFVYVGYVVTNDQWCLVKQAKNIRRWGTSNGLGQLAEEGPQENTVLDPAGTVRIPMQSLVGLIECNDKLWNA